MTIATSNIRTLIPFAGGNYDELVSHPVFSALVQQVPTFWGLHEGEFFIFDFIENDVNVDLENNEARSTGTKTKRKENKTRRKTQRQQTKKSTNAEREHLRE